MASFLAGPFKGLNAMNMPVRSCLDTRVNLQQYRKMTENEVAKKQLDEKFRYFNFCVMITEGSEFYVDGTDQNLVTSTGSIPCSLQNAR